MLAANPHPRPLQSNAVSADPQPGVGKTNPSSFSASHFSFLLQPVTL
jgi:hypothetical protein